MTDKQKITLIDRLLEEARKPEMRKMPRMGGIDGHRFRIMEMLIDDNDEKYWVSIEYIDR